MSRSRHNRKQHRPRTGMLATDRRIEHKRRRARLKREPLGSESKAERCYERWDKWNWD